MSTLRIPPYPTLHFILLFDVATCHPVLPHSCPWSVCYSIMTLLELAVLPPALQREEIERTQATALAERVKEAHARQRAAMADGRRLRRAADAAREELAGLTADREALREALRVQQEEQSSGAAVAKMHEYEEKVGVGGLG